MKNVVEWSMREAAALQAALRLTNEEFAEQLGVSVRAVANWRKGGDGAISLQIQRIFDTVLERATDAERERFAQLTGLGDAAADGDELRRRLDAATHLHSALGWLQGDSADDAAAGVFAAAAQLDAAAGPRWRTSETDRSAVAERLHQYYAGGLCRSASSPDRPRRRSHRPHDPQCRRLDQRRSRPPGERRRPAIHIRPRCRRGAAAGLRDLAAGCRDEARRVPGPRDPLRRRPALPNDRLGAAG